VRVSASGHWHRRLRHARRWLAYALAVLVVLAATVVGIASQLLPLVQREPQRIAAWLSAQSGQPVQLASAEAAWTRRGPLLTLRGLHVGAPGAGLTIAQAQLLVSVYSGLIPGMPLTELRLSGTHLQLARGADGRWQVNGLAGGQTTASNPLDILQGLGELQLVDAALHVDAPDLGIDFTVPRANVRVRVGARRVRAGANAWIGEAPPVKAVLDLARHGGHGRVFVGGEHLDLAPWAPVLAVAGVEVRGGEGELSIWATLRQHQIAQVRARLDLSKFALRGRVPIALEDGAVEPRFGLDRVQGDLLWSANGPRWRLRVPRLRLQDGRDDAVLDGLRVDGGPRGSPALVSEHASEFDARIPSANLRAMASLLALSDALPDGLRHWLYSAAPHGTALGLGISRDAGGELAAQVQLQNVGWLAAPGRPGVEGIGGRIEMQGEALAFEPDMSDFVFDWPEGFIAPIHGSLGGRVVVWRDADGWQLESPDFALRAEEIRLDGQVRFALPDEAPPRMDLALTLGSAPIVAAKRFWLLNDMSPNAVEWLNRGLVDGRIEGGEVIVAGPLQGFPYRELQGRFDARLQLAGITLAYHPDWPVGEALGGEARFSGDSFSMHGAARVLGIEIDALDGRIDDFRQGLLQLDLSGSGAGAQLLSLVRTSPLNQRFGSAISGLSLGGKARLAMNMQQPLKEGAGEQHIQGTIDLIRAPLADSRWDVAFASADGRIRFTDHGLLADALSVPVGDNLGSLSVAVGDFTADPASVLEVSLHGRMSADTLIDHYPTVDWLRPVLRGQSEWNLSINVPRGRSQPSSRGAGPSQDTDDGPALLHLSSDLVGTALSLPPPLRKDAEQALPLEIRTPLPLADGELQVQLGGLMRLRARAGDDDRLHGTLAFGRADDALTATQGLSVVGNVPVLDVAGWASFAAGAGAGEGSPGDDRGAVEQVDLLAEQLDLLDSALGETRVQLQRASDGVQVRFDGDDVRGVLDVPGTLPTPLHGRFERLYWPASKPSQDNGASADPLATPPLDFVIDDLRFGASQLGRAVLMAYPTPEGMHVERLETSHPGQVLTASGDWTRMDGASRSRFALEFRGDDLGRMLDALGFSGVIHGGKTRVAMAGSWPGSPVAFDMRLLDGTLDLDVGAGRIVDVEPGAGRMLGLISITQIPRRLLLDFSDIFGDGLAFNSLRGHFELKDGQARTDDLRVDAAAAEILVKGRAGLAAQDYDQLIDVRPKASSVLPAVGALAAGPVGIAIGAVAQAILQRPLKRAARTVYHVTGSWAAPEVNVVTREPVPEPEAEPPAVPAQPAPIERQ
jgi:uncharacterized protein (TIGR02099 family)